MKFLVKTVGNKEEANFTNKLCKFLTITKKTHAFYTMTSFGLPIFFKYFILLFSFQGKCRPTKSFKPKARKNKKGCSKDAKENSQNWWSPHSELKNEKEETKLTS